jgi:catechol 2,3-dioxygenase-like lactoylglutathione lyase family enzyme
MLAVTVTAYRSVLVGVSNLERALHLFGTVMELRLERQGPLSRELLDAWHVPAHVTAREAELSCRGYPFGRLRLVEYTPTPQTRVRVDFGPGAPDSPLDIGPKAIDFYVADPIGPWLERVVAAGCVARSAPRRHRIGQSESEEVVVSGPDDLPVLLMVGHRHAPTSLRPGSPDGPFSEIATSSVICGDIAESRRFYGEGLGLIAVNDAETPDQYRDLVADLVDAPRGTRVHFLLYAQPGEASGKTLLIHFYGRSRRRLAGRMRPGHLGFSLFSHETDDIERLAQTLPRLGGTIVTPPTRVTTERGSSVLMLVRGPNEELLEISMPG